MPILVVNPDVKRETGRKTQTDIIDAAKAVSDVVRTTLGPRAMLKMLMDPNGNVVLTNDGAGILREIEVKHPAAKTIIELSRTQDERVGDGTTSVVVLAGELLDAARPFLVEGTHATRVVAAFHRVLDDSLELLETLAKPIDRDDLNELRAMAAQSLQTKFVARFGSVIPDMAVEAVCNVRQKEGDSYRVDIKTLVKVEKISGGTLKDSKVLRGVMLNKDVLHSNMRRRVKNPRIMLLDCPIEYKKAESETNIELADAFHWRRYLELEEEHIRSLCTSISRLKPDVLVTEKGVSDMAQHFLQAAGISVLRRTRKSDLQRLALCCGAKIGSQPKNMTEAELGTSCALFEVRKIGDEYFSFFEECTSPAACSVLLRGASKDVLCEIERNLQDAMAAVKNALIRPKKLPGGGATEVALATRLRKKALAGGSDIELLPYLAAAKALEVVPRTLAENCGGNVARVMAELRAAHEEDETCCAGVDGKSGRFAAKAPVWEPAVVKEVALKTAFEAATMLLRIDDIVIGQAKPQGQGPPGMMPGL